MILLHYIIITTFHMKKNNKILTLALLVFLIPFTIISGQEKKVEKRIKIIIKDEAGTKEILDTLITGDSMNDSIILRDNKTIYLKSEASDDLEGPHGSKKYVYVNKSHNSDTEKEITKYIIDRDGVRITVEGSDYKKVKDIIKQIESDLDSHMKEKKHPE
jgi:hypothetical protein